MLLKITFINISKNSLLFRLHSFSFESHQIYFGINRKTLKLISTFETQKFCKYRKFLTNTRKYLKQIEQLITNSNVNEMERRVKQI